LVTESPSGIIPFETPPPGTFDAIFAALDACSHDVIGPMRPRLLVIPIRDDAGEVAGGFWGCTLFQWLHVQLLLIPEPLRGRGIGSNLMTVAETEARQRGCIGSQVTSFSFQAAPFYEKLGYTTYAQLDDYPPGHNLLYLRKRFDTVPALASDQQRALNRARAFAVTGEDEAAMQAYVDVLRLDPTNFPALNEIGTLANVSFHHSAARTAFAQAVRCHPDNPAGRVNLANVLLDDGDVSAARTHFEAALAVDPDLPEAHQGLARVLTELGDEEAEPHWQKGFAGHAVVTKKFRGHGAGEPLLLLVAARGGNIPTRYWIDDRHFAITAIYTEFHEPTQSLPPHALIVNAIGDADLCGMALTRAEALMERGTAPLINPPSLVLATRRIDNARRFSRIPGVIAPKIRALTRAEILAADGMSFPVLLRAPGFHTGRHFTYVESHHALREAAATLPGEKLLAIKYVDARLPDGMTRKYRVMFIGGALYPAHLAISADWKVHYFSASMAANPAHREEERRFLEDMAGVLGRRAMTALAAIQETLGLDYAGVDFALTPDGSVLVFEANATMAINPPEPGAIWDYRRRAAADVLDAARGLLARRAGLDLAIKAVA